jgi:hypothetical protein
LHYVPAFIGTVQRIVVVYHANVFCVMLTVLLGSDHYIESYLDGTKRCLRAKGSQSHHQIAKLQRCKWFLPRQISPELVPALVRHQRKVLMERMGKPIGEDMRAAYT